MNHYAVVILPFVLGFALISIPILGQFLPERFRASVLTPRTRVFLTSGVLALYGCWLAWTSTASIISIWLGGVLFGIAVCQALAAIDIRLLLGRRLVS